MKDLISMRDLSKDDILYFLDIAHKIESDELKPNLHGKLAALLFFEPSTRTHFSFETAMKRLGGETFSMSGTSSSSVSKGETLHDTLKTISMYADIIVMRHVVEGAARFAGETVHLPVVNAGDGTNQHPTQALLDMYSIKKTQGTINNLTFGLVGDLRLGRTVHSLVQALMDFSPKFYFASPTHLRMPQYIKDDLIERGIPFEEVKEIDPILHELDIMYVTRIQKERFAVPEDYERVKDSYIITNEFLMRNGKIKDNFRILHPLPRVSEITTDVDNTPYAYYFQQARNGVFMRQAIISVLLKAI